MMQLTHSKVAQPKPGALRPRVCHWFQCLSGTNARQSAEKILHEPVADICRCLPPDWIWHKVNDPKGDCSGDLGEGKVGHQPMLEPCWSMLLIDPLSAMSI